MSFTSGLCIGLLACLFLSMSGAVDGAVSSPPLNAVAKVNGEAVFNCSATPSGPLLWTMTKDGISTGEIRITTGCNVNSGLQNHYRTEQPGGQTTCNLIVFDITLDHAGVYHCTDSDSFRALLTVLDSSPTMTYNNTPDVMVEEKVVMTCNLTYNGSVEPASTLRPHFYWTNNTRSNVSNVYNEPPSNNSVVSQLTVTAGRENIMPYTCHAYLQLIQTAIPGYATNTPTVDSSASSPTITVLYPVDKNYISIHSTVPTDDKCVSKTENLNCTADANPPAQYMWLDVKNNITTTGANKSISSGGDFQCIASNSIRNQTYSIAENVTETNCSTSSSSLIWLAFLIIPGVGVIFGVVFVIYYGKSDKKSTYNRYFPFLEKMLPCMNTDASATTFERCGWIILYILMVTTVGFIMIPIMFIRVQFCSSANGADVNDVELNRTAHPETDAPPPKETHAVDEKANDENVVKKTKKKKKQKVTA